VEALASVLEAVPLEVERRTRKCSHIHHNNTNLIRDSQDLELLDSNSLISDLCIELVSLVSLEDILDPR